MQTENARPSKIGAVFRVTSGNFLEMFDFFLFGLYASIHCQDFFPVGQRNRLADADLRAHSARLLMRLLGAIFWRLRRPIGVGGADPHARASWRAAPPDRIRARLRASACCAPILVLVGRLLQGSPPGSNWAACRSICRKWRRRATRASTSLAVGQPAGRDHGRGGLMARCSSKVLPAAMRLGLAHPVLHRLHDRAVPVLYPPSLEETEEFLARKHRPTQREIIQVDGAELAASCWPGCAGHDDHGLVLH